MTHFRKRISGEMIDQVSEWIVGEQSKLSFPKDDDDNRRKSSSETFSQPDQKEETPCVHQGKLLIDATCAPADITYPTELKLLNEAREKLEAMIDRLHEPFCGKHKKTRTYRQ